MEVSVEVVLEQLILDWLHPSKDPCQSPRSLF